MVIPASRGELVLSVSRATDLQTSSQIVRSISGLALCRSNDGYDLYPEGDDEAHGISVKGSQVYVWVYGALTFAFFAIQVIRTGLMFYGATCGANRLYKKMLHRVLNTPMGFFLVKPVGELLNTFSSDQNKADEALPDAAHLACAPTHHLLMCYP